MGRKEHLDIEIRESYNLIREYEDILRLSDDPKEKERARRNQQEQWNLINGYFGEYIPLCEQLRVNIPDDLLEIVGHFPEYIERLRNIAATAARSGEQKSYKHQTPGVRGRGQDTISVPETQFQSAVTYFQSVNILDTSHLQTLMASVDLPDPIFLLGAGASQKSGVPLRGVVVEQAAKRAYCRFHQRVTDDPTVRRSDWLDWLKQQYWYNAQLSSEAQYIAALTHLLQPTEERRSFLHRIARPQIEPSAGYTNLLRLAATQYVRTILTTNFDDVLPGLAKTMSSPHHLAVIRSPDDYQWLSTAPIHPQLVYLHGDVDRYVERYFAGGSDRLEAELIANLLPLLRDHPLIVVGYSGSEQSIMQHLLVGNAQVTQHYKHGLYWCIPSAESSGYIDPLVKSLADVIGDNFRPVIIKDFDTLMEDLLQATQQRPTPLVPAAQQSTLAPSFDMQAVPDLTLDFLDWNELQQRLFQYCQDMDIVLPQALTREAIIVQMLALDLARKVDNNIYPTVAGCLLFGKASADSLPSARIEVQISGEPPVIFRGNLWSQLRVIDVLDSDVNIPFRLKGRLSETVTPYPSLALKEVMVNAVAHRRYNGGPSEAIVVRVEPDRIIVTSPGGLFESARRQIPPEVSPEEALGNRPIKGYRNPVIADFLYSTGEMDKLGSGLIDVRKWMRHNGGDVHFRLDTADSFFQVVLYRRPERPDEHTGAASPLTLSGEFISNILELVELPDTIWAAETDYRRVEQILRQSQGLPLPAFVLYDGHLFCFSDLSLHDNPLRQYINCTGLQSQPLSQFAIGDTGERRLSNLLNEALRSRLEGLGLIFDWKFKRAYFPRTKVGERRIEYQARLRRATRTVVKARVHPSTGEPVYWEHQALKFQFRRFAQTWGLQLLPTYVFTWNGFKKQLPGERSGPLATRRLSREYNVHVDSHLFFWTAYFSGNSSELILEDAFDSRIILRSTTTSCILRTLELQSETEENLPVGEEELDDLEIEGELLDLWGEQGEVDTDDNQD